MCLLLAGNDTVPISSWRGGGMHSTEYRPVHARRCLIMMLTMTTRSSAVAERPRGAPYYLKNSLKFNVILIYSRAWFHFAALFRLFDCSLTRMQQFLLTTKDRVRPRNEQSESAITITINLPDAWRNLSWRRSFSLLQCVVGLQQQRRRRRLFLLKAQVAAKCAQLASVGPRRGGKEAERVSAILCSGCCS